MRWLLIVVIVFCLGGYAYADDITFGDCSPVINNRDAGIVIFNCLDPKIADRINGMPSLQEFNNNIRAMNTLKGEVDNLSESLGRIGNKTQQNKEIYQNLNIRLRKNREELNKLWMGNLQLRKAFSEQISKLETSQKSFENRAEQFLEERSNQIYNYISDKLVDFDMRLTEVERELEEVKYNLSLLMSKFIRGELEENFWFFGLSFGGVAFEDGWQPQGAIEAEVLIPKIPLFNCKGSVYAELSYLDWEQTASFETLPGLEKREIVDDHEMTSLNAGLRLFPFLLAEGVYPAFSVSGGHTIAGDEDTWYFNAGAGIEFARPSARLALEVRYEHIVSVEKTTVTFNPFGSAIVNTEEEPSNGIYVGMRISIR